MKELNFTPFPILRSNRILLRQIIEEDAQLIYNYQSDKDNFPYVDMQIYTEIDEARKYITKMNKGVKENQWIIWAIADPQTNIILGTISIWNISEKNSKAELGYGLFPGNIGKGIMSEALKKVIDYGFNTMGLLEIEAYTNRNNMKSIALLVRSQFKKIADFEEKETFSGEPMDMVIYGLSTNSELL
ncbi:GNAT family N-acetyltransferase [Vallitalea okinawensis]|uniref:GNAT family N-acetyltransferase n=1 Tax=Vallitalea okinawensis TaxID=2078660 RepID=UPI000CFCB2D3|nr:GNAT family N-acetyltransferase [Vallitalea okinawensis]